MLDGGHDRKPRARLVALALLALPLGCAKGDSQATPPAGSSSTAAAQAPTPTPTPPSASAKQERHGREHAGPAGTIFRAARDLELTTRRKRRSTASSRSSRGRAAERRLQDAPGGHRHRHPRGQARSGEASDRLRRDRQDVAALQAKEAEALSGLYAALEPAQRKVLVDAVRAKQAAREAQFDAHLAGDAGAPAEWTKRRLDRMTAQLGLDARSSRRWRRSSPRTTR